MNKSNLRKLYLILKNKIHREHFLFPVKMMYCTNVIIQKKSSYFLKIERYNWALINLNHQIYDNAVEFLDEFCIYFYLLNKNTHNIFWSKIICKKNFQLDDKIIFHTIRNIILKNLKTRNPVRLKSYKDFNQKKKIKSLEHHLLKKAKTNFCFQWFFTYLIPETHVFWLKMWYQYKFLKFAIDVSWWRTQGIREIELEYYDQYTTSFYSYETSEFIKKKKKTLNFVFLFKKIGCWKNFTPFFL